MAVSRRSSRDIGLSSLHQAVALGSGQHGCGSWGIPALVLGFGGVTDGFHALDEELESSQRRQRCAAHVPHHPGYGLCRWGQSTARSETLNSSICSSQTCPMIGQHFVCSNAANDSMLLRLGSRLRVGLAFAPGLAVALVGAILLDASTPRRLLAQPVVANVENTPAVPIES